MILSLRKTAIACCARRTRICALITRLPRPAEGVGPAISRTLSDRHGLGTRRAIMWRVIPNEDFPTRWLTAAVA